MKLHAFLRSLILLLCTIASTTAASGITSSDPADLHGRWETRKHDDCTPRQTLEFFPDYRCTITQAWKLAEGGEKSTTRDLLWAVEGDRVVIRDRGVPCSPDFENHQEIALPFDLEEPEITEVQKSPTSTTTTTKRLRRALDREPAGPDSPEDFGRKLTREQAEKTIEVSISASARRKPYGYYTLERVTPVVSVKNLDLRNPVGELEATIIFIGQNEGTPKQYKVLSKQTVPLELGTQSSNRTQKIDFEPFENKIPASPKYRGHCDFGLEEWLFVLADAQHNTLIVKASDPRWVENYQRVLPLTPGDIINER